MARMRTTRLLGVDLRCAMKGGVARLPLRNIFARRDLTAETRPIPAYQWEAPRSRSLLTFRKEETETGAFLVGSVASSE